MTTPEQTPSIPCSPVSYVTNIWTENSNSNRSPWFCTGNLVFRFAQELQTLAEVIEVMDTSNGAEMTLRRSGQLERSGGRVVDCVCVDKLDYSFLVLVQPEVTNLKASIHELKLKFELKSYEQKSEVDVHDELGQQVDWKRILQTPGQPERFLVVSRYHTWFTFRVYDHAAKVVHQNAHRVRLDRKRREIFDFHVRPGGQQVIFLERDAKYFGSKNSLKSFDLERKRAIAPDLMLTRKAEQVIATSLVEDRFFVLISSQTANDRILWTNLTSRSQVELKCGQLDCRPNSKFTSCLDADGILTIHSISRQPTSKTSGRTVEFRSFQLAVGSVE